MAKRTLNFDNFMVEQKQEPIVVTVYGEDYKVKPQIPAIVMVTLARAETESMGNQEAVQMIFRAGDAMFGAETINKFCAKGMEAGQLLDLIKRLFDVINGKGVDDDEEEMDDEGGMASGSKAKK